jgi:FlaA1/EpsC-like NDP-sugar epimerase
MMVPEAAPLVIQASAMAEGGDVFLLEMGQLVKIRNLPRREIKLVGLTFRDEKKPDGDIAVEIIGLHPGEKLYEEQLIDNNAKATSNPRILEANEDFIGWGDLN